MIQAAVSLLLLGAPVGVGLVEVEELPRSAAVEITHQLAREIERASGRQVVVLESGVGSCSAACAPAVRKALDVDEVVLLRLFDGPRHVHALVERHPPAGAPRRATRDLSKSSLDNRPELAALAGSLFPERPPAAPGLVVGDRPSPVVSQDGDPPASSILPWIPIGAAAALSAASFVFFLESRSSEADLRRTPVVLDEDYRRISAGESRARTTGAVLLGAAGAALAVSMWITFGG